MICRTMDVCDIQTEFRIYQNDDVMLDDSDEREVLKHLAEKNMLIISVTEQSGKFPLCL